MHINAAEQKQKQTALDQALNLGEKNHLKCWLLLNTQINKIENSLFQWKSNEIHANSFLNSPMGLGLFKKDCCWIEMKHKKKEI